MKIENEKCAVWYEKYKPSAVEDLILPDEMKSNLQKYIETETLPHLGLFGFTGGCLLPGTNIRVEAEEDLKSYSEIKKEFELTKQQMGKLRKYLDSSAGEQIDRNRVTPELLIIITSKNSQAGTLSNLYRMDSVYHDKHLKIVHWLSKLSIDDAIKKVKILRKYSEYFDFDAKNFDEKWNYDNIQDTVNKIKFKMIYTDFKTLLDINYGCLSMFMIDFWTFRGWSEQEAKEKISKLQKQIYKRCEDKFSPGELFNIRGSGQRIEKYLKQGFSLEESKQLLKERQTTFSLKKCIEKYGDVEGQRVFNERQFKWQETLNSKSQEEKNDLNRRKSNGAGKYPDKTIPGKLYYMRFYNDEIEFWKIGITIKDVINGRYPDDILMSKKYNLKYEVIFIKEDTIGKCYNVEQNILKHFNKFRISIDFSGFKTTEAFSQNIFKDYK